MKAAAYCRFSSSNQREESIDAQLRAIKEYSKQNNIIIVKIYIDKAKSATTDNRPQFLQMINDSNKNLFSLIIVHKLDRFARDRYDSAHYKKILSDNEVKVISVLERLDDSPESVILESMLEGMAEYYSRNLAREVMKGLKENALECKFCGGKPPLGFDISLNKTYVINNHEAEIIKVIFEMYASGYGYTKIIKHLNMKEYRTKAGNNFSTNSLHDILINEKYIGVYTFNKTEKRRNGHRNRHKYKNESEIIRIENGVPAIISKAVWNEVQKKMNKNKEARARSKASEVYLLSGLIFCGNCNGSMVGNKRYPSKDRPPYYSYECNNRKRKKNCTMRSIRKEKIEMIAINYLEQQLFSNEGIETIIKKLQAHCEKVSRLIPNDVKKYNNQLSGINKQFNNIVEAIASGMFQSSMKEKISSLENTKADLEIKIAETKRKQELHKVPTKKDIINYIKNDIIIKSKEPEEQRRILQKYIQKVIVYENNDQEQQKINIHSIVDFIGAEGGTRTHT